MSNKGELPYAIEVILVSSRSLECQLSFDTLLNMSIVCITGVIVFSEVFWPLEATKGQTWGSCLF